MRLFVLIGHLQQSLDQITKNPSVRLTKVHYSLLRVFYGSRTTLLMTEMAAPGPPAA